MVTNHADLLADLLEDTYVIETYVGNGMYEVEINGGIDSVFIDVDCEALPITMKGVIHVGDKSYELRYTLEHYYGKTRQAEYGIELV
jgi:hypothetical protein